MCGLLFAVTTQTFLGLRWLPRFPTLPFVKALHSLCPLTSNLGRARFWVGRNGWIRSCPTEVSWGLLQRTSVLKAIVSSRFLSNFRDLFNLRHLVCWWCTTTHTFFFSCNEITVTLEDVANQLLLPILGDIDPGTLELSSEEEAVEAELKKKMNGNAKLSYWVSSSF